MNKATLEHTFSGKWQELRQLVRTNYPQLWGNLRTTRHFFNDRYQDWKENDGTTIVKNYQRLFSHIYQVSSEKKSSVIWLDLGRFGELIEYDHSGPFQDHGLGLLRTILHNNGVETDLASTRNVKTLTELEQYLDGYSMLLMNVRSYHYEIAVEAARLFHRLNPDGIVAVGGIHTKVDPEQMKATRDFDKICIGAGENVITDLVRNPESFPRCFEGAPAKSMEDWPVMDRTLLPRPSGFALKFKYNWPLEEGMQWGPRPAASILTSRVCPWQCSFCNESSYIANIRRRKVDSVIDELNELDDKYGVGSVAIHDSMFFQQPKWLEEWLDKYPRKANKLWPYWAAGRADTVCQWPDLFEALVKETNWNVVSIGFESGSDPMLKMLNKQVTEEENDFVIQLVNRIGDEMEKAGKKPVSFWANTMLAIPGETREDAFKTIRMLKKMKRTRPAIAYYTPFPGSFLGYQIIAEGKNIDMENYVRGRTDEKIKDIDYDFYRALLRGEYDEEVNQGLTQEEKLRNVLQFFKEV